MNYEVGQIVQHWVNGVMWQSKIIRYDSPSQWFAGGYQVLLNTVPGNTMTIQESDIVGLATVQQLGMCPGSVYRYDNI